MGRKEKEMKLNLKNVKITFPEDFESNPTDSDVVEWMEYELGARSNISLSNPLVDLELKDCNVFVSETSINDKPFVF